MRTRDIRRELLQRALQGQTGLEHGGKLLVEETAMRRSRRAQRHAKVLSLRRNGMAFSAIGKAIGLTAGRAHQLYQMAVRIERQQEAREAATLPTATEIKAYHKAHSL